MIFKIRVVLDAQEDVFRDIAIHSRQTLYDLHTEIKDSFGLQGEELSAFHLLTPEGEISRSVSLEDLSDHGGGETFEKVYIEEFFNLEGDKAQFQYGFIELWEFFCEYISAKEEHEDVLLPTTVFRFGELPSDPPTKNPGFFGEQGPLLYEGDLGIDQGFDEFSSYGEEDCEEDF
ncbi:MAG: plasmid pRiA4b ORF-3 family protein [Bergeyella sp.]|nr:plasmid pRiA4b ORF-3 family protein [Bergeyella sp.]